MSKLKIEDVPDKIMAIQSMVDNVLPKELPEDLMSAVTLLKGCRIQLNASKRMYVDLQEQLSELELDKTITKVQVEQSKISIETEIVAITTQIESIDSAIDRINDYKDKSKKITLLATKELLKNVLQKA